MNELLNELITKVFVEQPLALPGSAKYISVTYLETGLLWSQIWGHI